MGNEGKWVERFMGQIKTLIHEMAHGGKEQERETFSLGSVQKEKVHLG